MCMVAKTPASTAGKKTANIYCYYSTVPHVKISVNVLKLASKLIVTWNSVSVGQDFFSHIKVSVSRDFQPPIFFMI